MDLDNSGDFGQLPDEMIIEILDKMRKGKECFPFLMTCKRISKLWQKMFEIGDCEIIIEEISVGIETLQWCVMINKNRDQFVMVSSITIIEQVKNKGLLPSTFIYGKMKKRRSKREFRKFIKLGWLSFMINVNGELISHDVLNGTIIKTNKDDYKPLKLNYEKRVKEIENELDKPEFYTFCCSNWRNNQEEMYLSGW